MSSTTAPSNERVPVNVIFNTLMFLGPDTADLVFLWTTCREVSRNFKTAAERVFVARHLNKTTLWIYGGVHENAKGRGLLPTYFSMPFVQLDPADRSRALFRDARSAAALGANSALIKTTKEMYSDPKETPYIVVVIRHEANDSSVPDLKPNWDDYEVSCDWVAMVSAWVREEAEHAKQLAAFVEKNKDLWARRGMRGIEESVMSMGREFVDAWKRIRLARVPGVKRTWTKTDEEEWSRRKEVQKRVDEDGQVFSDEEDEEDEEEEEGEDGEGDGDEWVTDDEA